MYDLIFEEGKLNVRDKIFPIMKEVLRRGLLPPDEYEHAVQEIEELE